MINAGSCTYEPAPTLRTVSRNSFAVHSRLDLRTIRYAKTPAEHEKSNNICSLYRLNYSHHQYSHAESLAECKDLNNKRSLENPTLHSPKMPYVETLAEADEMIMYALYVSSICRSSGTPFAQTRAEPTMLN